MTIDEEIKFRKHNIELAKQISDEEMRCQEVQRLEWLNELKWYRGQDLIPRKDALERIENLKRLERHHDHVITLHHSYCAIREIPKIEPPTSSKMEQVATDTNVARSSDCDGCFGASFGDCDDCKEPQPK